MPDLTSGDYVYFRDNEEEPKRHHKTFTLDQESGFSIESPLKLTIIFFVIIRNLFVKKMIEPWIVEIIQVVYKLSKINIWINIYIKRNT